MVFIKVLNPLTDSGLRAAEHIIHHWVGSKVKKEYAVIPPSRVNKIISKKQVSWALRRKPKNWPQLESSAYNTEHQGSHFNLKYLFLLF